MSEEDKNEITKEAGKHLVWQLLDSYNELKNMSAYTRSIIRKQDDCYLLRKAASKNLRVKYSIPHDGGYTSVVWWLLEEWEKGNVTIKKDEVQPEL